jgi:hypothetical protein
MAQIAKIIKPPHLLFVGDNSYKTFGVTVENINYVEGSGRSKIWDINDHDILHASNCKDALGLTDIEYKNLVSEIETLVKNQ